jgi:hypothetical protein
LVAAATAGLLVAGTAGGVVFNTYAAHIISWDNGATSEAAVWLHDHAASERVSCTLLLCSQIWFRAGGDLDISLLPQFAARTGPTRLADLRFDERNGWSGRTRVSRPDEGRVLVLTKSDELFGGVFEGALLDDLNRRRPRYVAVTGNVASNATFEAGRLLPYFRDNPSFRLVFTSSLDALPTFVAIYEMTGPARPRPAGPGLISTRATRALRGLPAGAVQWLPARIFRQMVRQVLVSAPARGA